MTRTKGRTRSTLVLCLLVVGISFSACVAHGGSEIVVADLQFDSLRVINKADIHRLPHSLTEQFLRAEDANVIEITLLSSVDLIAETNEKQPMTLGATFRFCDDVTGATLFANREVIFSGAQVGEWSTPSSERGAVALISATERMRRPHRYHVYLHVAQAQRANMLREAPPHPAYDLRSKQKDVCLRLGGKGSATWLNSNEAVVPKSAFGGMLGQDRRRRK